MRRFEGDIVNTVTSWFRREDRFLFLSFFLERFRSSEGKKASVEKAGGGACASTHHRGSALRRGGTTPGVVSSAACAVTLARSSFTSRAHSHVAARTFRLSFSLKISLRLTPFPNVSRSTRRKRNTVIEELFLPFTTPNTVRSPSVMCDREDLARPLPINENDARK